MNTLSDFLNINDVEQFSGLAGKEYMFNEAVERGVLMDVLNKFGKPQEIHDYLDHIYFNRSSLKYDWKDKLLSEVNSLVDLLPQTQLRPIKYLKIGEPDYSTSEMFTLQIAGNRFFRNELKKTYSISEAVFLSEFFYGIDFTHWTRFAVLVKYTDLDVDLTTIANVILAGVQIAISGEELVVDRLPES